VPYSSYNHCGVAVRCGVGYRVAVFRSVDMHKITEPWFHLYSSGDIEGDRIQYLHECPSWKELSILLSFAKYSTKWTKRTIHAAQNGNAPYRLMLDSGAFSAYTGTANISLSDYVHYIHHMGDVFDVWVSFDDITSPERSWRSVNKLLDAGINRDKLLPVYHYGEDMKWLHRIAGLGFRYIGLGGVARNVPKPVIRHFVHKCIYHFPPGEYGFKFHLFGCSNNMVLNHYPLFSCDSLAPLLAAALYGDCISMNGGKRRGFLTYTGAKFGADIVAKEAEALALRQREIGSRWREIHQR